MSTLRRFQRIFKPSELDALGVDRLKKISLDTLNSLLVVNEIKKVRVIQKQDAVNVIFRFTQGG